MYAVNPQQLIQMLAAWLSASRSPYQVDQQAPSPVQLNLGSHLAEIQTLVSLQSDNPNQLELEIVHTLRPLQLVKKTKQLKAEVNAFNNLMESVRLPVVVGWCAQKGHWVFSWQERIQSRADLFVVDQLYKQSFQMAFCLLTRLMWELGPARTSPSLMH